MRGLRNIFVFGVTAVSLALPQLAMSADTSKDAAKGQANIDETKQHDRGFAFTPLNETKPVQAPVSTGTVKKTEVTKAIEGLPSKKVGKTQCKPVLTAVQKPKQSKTTTMTASHQTNKAIQSTPVNTQQQAAENSAALVKFENEGVGGAVISAKLDRNGTLPSYKVGDKMIVNVKANQDCNVVVFNYDSTGTLTQIFPNDYQQNGFVKSGETVQIGGAESPFDYQIAGKGGPEKVFVYAYPTGGDFKNPLTAMGKKTEKIAMAPIAGTPFRGVEMTVDKYRELVNSSNVFFARSVEVKPRQVSGVKTAQMVSSAAPAATPNKVELTFTVEK